jgi:hypothetical protein
MNAFTQEKVSRAGAPEASQDAPNDLVVTIVMPCLNEAESLAPCIEMAHEGLRLAGVKGEILIADNGSTDGSQELAESLGARVAHIQARGYGSALQGGIAAARGKYVLMGDADGSYDFRHLNRFLQRLDEGYDLVMGNRFAGGIAKGAMPPLHQYFGNPGLSWLGRLFFKSKVGDFYCGLRAFRRDAIEKLHLQSPGMEFGVEMVAKASMYGLRVTQVPTTLSPDLRSRPPHLRTWRDGWRTLRFFLLYSPRWLFFYPGMLLMVLGLILGIALLPGPLDVGSARLDVHTLLYAGVAVVVGFQAVVFAVLARVYAASEGFLPDNHHSQRARALFSLEAGLAAGGAMVLAAVVLTVIAFVDWDDSSFRHLNYPDSLRLTIPAAVMLMLGVQTLLSSFFLSVLGIKQAPETGR